MWNFGSKKVRGITDIKISIIIVGTKLKTVTVKFLHADRNLGNHKTFNMYSLKIESDSERFY